MSKIRHHKEDVRKCNDILCTLWIFTIKITKNYDVLNLTESQKCKHPGKEVAFPNTHMSQSTVCTVYSNHCQHI